MNYNGYPDTSGNTITYDDNGNMKTHIDKGIENLSYNHLNLPNYTLFNFGLATRNGILQNNTSYLYRADGVKLKKTYNFAPYDPLGTATELTTEVTDYIDGFQYKGNGKTGKGGFVSLLFYPTAEGYYNFENNKYIYNYTDHLGNVRLSYFSGSNGVEVLEENNYYPFGLKHEGYNPTVGNASYQYKYNGKELQETGMYDYGARFYMPDIGRWGVVDPLAEKYQPFSGYNYVLNNPISNIDPDGMEVFTDYKLLQNGKIERVDPNDGTEKNNSDSLYATDRKGNINKKIDPLTINKEKPTDSTIISELESQNKNKDQIVQSGAENLKNTINVFQFASQNSIVEWSAAIGDNWTNAIATSNKYLGTPFLGGYVNNMYLDIHSHQETPGPSSKHSRIYGSKGETYETGDQIASHNATTRRFIYYVGSSPSSAPGTLYQFGKGIVNINGVKVGDYGNYKKIGTLYERLIRVVK